MDMSVTLNGSCHCQAVKWQFNGKPSASSACNCTICRRYGAIWIYGYEGVGEDIEITGELHSYARDSKSISFYFCPKCGCVIKWSMNKLTKSGKLKCAINARSIDDPKLIEDIKLEHFDGLDTFEDLPLDGKCIKDIWF